MIATHNQTNHLNLSNLLDEVTDAPSEQTTAVSTLTHTSQLLLSNRFATHTPHAGLNPLVDAAGYLFSVLGKLKQLKSYRQLSKLQKELLQEMVAFQEAIKNRNYNPEYILVCRYALCATFDDIIANTSWGGQGGWDSFSLLTALNQDTQHQDKFFTILERAIKEPIFYIDLMEFMYICLSMGYKGQYRATEHSQYQLDQITNSLYKHIQAHRGHFSKVLSPTPFKTPASITKMRKKNRFSLPFIFCITACIIMTIFISLGYLTDVISNEAYNLFAHTEN